MQTAKVGDTAQWISKVDGTPHLGDVIEAGETYADVQWRQNGRVERIQFSHPDGVTFEHVIHHVSECSRPYDWSGEHLFEDDEVELNPEGYDEYERCGLPADDPLHVEGAHAAALRRNALEDRLAQGAPFVARVRWYRTATGVGLREGWQAMVDEDHAEALTFRTLDPFVAVWGDTPDGVLARERENDNHHAPVCWRAGDHWPHMTAVGPDCRTLPTGQQ